MKVKYICPRTSNVIYIKQVKKRIQLVFTLHLNYKDNLEIQLFLVFDSVDVDNNN